MVGNGECIVHKKLEDVLTEKQVDCVVRKVLKNGGEWRLISSEVKPVADGLSGFLGDHLRVTLDVEAGGTIQSIKLFVKLVPLDNKPKADLIVKNGLFERESLICQLFNEIQRDNDPHPWCVNILISNNSMLVMPDVQPLGYSTRNSLETLDMPHLLATASTLARFHAATSNYEIKKSLQISNSWTFAQEYSEILNESFFKDTPWLRASAKVTTNILKNFSKKYNDISDLESKITNLFIEAIEKLKEYEDSLNVLLHRDLWTSNIMFRYEKDKPVNALLVDYQLLRYGPPAFDLMVFLYLTTSKALRTQYELYILKYYYKVFSENLEEATKQKLIKLGYDEKVFLQWCETARMFAAVQASASFPYILMDPVTAQKTFDNPETFEEVMMVDRSKPVLEYCGQNLVYRERLLEVAEEFADRYLNK